MDKSQDSIPEYGNTTVYYHNNPRLCAYGAAFHWWDAAYTSLHDHDYYEFFIIPPAEPITFSMEHPSSWEKKPSA